GPLRLCAPALNELREKGSRELQRRTEAGVANLRSCRSMQLQHSIVGGAFYRRRNVSVQQPGMQVAVVELIGLVADPVVEYPIPAFKMVPKKPFREQAAGSVGAPFTGLVARHQIVVAAPAGDAPVRSNDFIVGEECA